MSFIQMYEEKYIRFPDGKAKALTFSYDDGVKADARLIKILNAHGLKGTFNLNSNRFDCPEWHGKIGEEETKKLFVGCGHEVALHGARHVFLDKIPLAEAANEILQNRAYLEHMCGSIVRGMAYSYGAYNDEIVQMLKTLGVAYARTTEPTHSFSVPRDWLRLNPTCHHTDGQFPALAEKFFSSSPKESGKQREGWLFFLWGHAFEFDDDNNWDLIEKFCERAQAHSDEIWFATNFGVYDYVRAYNRLEFSLDGETVRNPSAIPVWIELRGKTYKIDVGATVKFDK